MFIWGLREKKLYLIWHFVVSYLKTKRNKSRHDKMGQNFLTWPNPKNTLTKLDFFLLEAKTGWPMTWHVFLQVNLTRPDPRPNPNPNLFFVFLTFFLVKKIVKLIQYWFNCLFWALRKQLIYLHNCMQINWKINGWAFCNE